MAIVRYSDQNEFDLSHSEQDCRGWTVVDQAGNELGTVSELILDTDAGHVDSIIISGTGAQVAAADIALKDGRVVVRGVVNNEEYEQTRTNYAASTAAATTTNYQASNRAADAQYVSGVTRAAGENEVTVPIVEEQLRVGKRDVEGGGVRVRTGITETPVQEQVTLREEHVHVERTPVNRPVSGSDIDAFREGEVTLTETAEVAVVAKEARVVEEVVIGKEVSERVETVSDTVRRTDVQVEEIDTSVDSTCRTSNS